MDKMFVKPGSFSSNKKNSFKLKLMLFSMRNFFKILSVFLPFLAQKIVLRVFLTPPKNSIPLWQKPFLDRALQSEIIVDGKVIKLYQWGVGPAILLVHGWGGRGSQLSAFIDPLICNGYSVLALDGPAHGDSSGKRSDMFEFASAIHAASEMLGPLHAIVAHSFGSACTLLALREHKLNVPKLVLIGCPSSAIWVTEKFADNLAISRKIVAGMRKQLEYRYKNVWTWEDLSVTKMLKNITIPSLIVHDRNDLEVPYQQALELVQANNTCELFTSEGHGHRRILRSPDVINKIVTFIKNN